MQTKPIPTQIKLHQKSRLLEIEFNDEETFKYPCEYLRTQGTSAEVKKSLLPVSGKINVNIEKIEPQGDYGIRFFFDDGYDQGIYAWETLYDLGVNQEEYWNSYLQQLKQFDLERGETDKVTEGAIKVLYFIDKLIKITRKEEEIIPLTPTLRTIEDLMQTLQSRGVSWKREFAEDKMQFTVNKEFAELFTVLENNDEVAFIPKGTQV